MKMSREDENNKMQDLISNMYLTTNPEIDRNIILMDISRSLAIIVDELTRREDDHEKK
ncbi:MAG: hypothetical protein J6R25_04080 [Bacteroidales bacterium]|nr:hypothetical protein [Bacteroidales bacterium]